MLWGVILFGYILGELASMLTNADAQRTRYIHRLNVIKEQLADAGVGRALKKRVVGYYEFLVRTLRGDNMYIQRCSISCNIFSQKQEKRENVYEIPISQLLFILC